MSIKYKIQLKKEYKGTDEETNLYLNEKLIYTVDKTLYAGFVRKNCELEICKVLSDVLKRSITPKELSTALILEQIEGDLK